MSVSLEGYQLRNHTKIEGSQGEGFQADLYKGNVKIALLIDAGEGEDVKVHFEQEEESTHQVLTDMETLLDLVADVTDEEALSHSFRNTPHSAVTGFSELLLELKDIEEIADQVYATMKDDQTYYIVGMTGSTWFKDLDEGMSMFGIPTIETEYAKAKGVQTYYIRTMRELQGDLMASFIIRGKKNWDLSFEDYSSFIRP